MQLLITRKEHSNVTSLEDLTKETVSRICIGTPTSVPAGQYAQDSLRQLRLWDLLQPKFVFAKDVTAVLNYVETGNADAKNTQIGCFFFHSPLFFHFHWLLGLQKERLRSESEKSSS